MKKMGIASESKEEKSKQHLKIRVGESIRFLLLAFTAVSMLVSITTITPVAGQPVDVCAAGGAQRTIHYDVAAIDIPLPINEWGDVNPQGMMYALNNPLAIPNVAQLKDPNFTLYNTTDQSVPKKTQPLVLRANVGDCIEVTLTNKLDVIFDRFATPVAPALQPVTPIEASAGNRTVGMQIRGLPYDPAISDGAFVGFNPDTTVASNLNVLLGHEEQPIITPIGPEQKKTYRWFANRTGGFMFRDISNPQWPEDTIVKGLFGMVIVEPALSTWRDSITGRNFLLANPQKGYNITDILPNPDKPVDPITGKPMFLGVGASIYADIHQPQGAPLPSGTLFFENVSGNDFRDYAMILHDEFEGLVGPEAFYENGTIAEFDHPFFAETGLQDSTILINYRSEPLRNRASAFDRHRGLIPTREINVGGFKVSGGLINGSDPNNPLRNATACPTCIDIPLKRGGILTVNSSNMTVILPSGRKILPGDDFCNGGNFSPDNARPGDINYTFYSCNGEDVHFSSWAFGDQAVPPPRAYWGDPVIMYVANADSHDTHTWHVHPPMRWWHDPDKADINLLPLPGNPNQRSTRLDVQGVGAGEVFKMVYEQGAGGPTGSAGDIVMHCHLYPHFAQGIWTSFRVFDKLRINFTDPNSINSTLNDSTPITYPDGTQEAVLQPLPARVALFNTADPNAVDHRAPAPPGMSNRTPAAPDINHPGHPNFIPGKVGQKALQPPQFIIDPNTGAPIKDRATPTQLEKLATYDGIRPGVVLVDPCKGPNGELKGPSYPKPDRIYEPFAIQVPLIQNAKGGFFNPEQRAYVEKERVDSVRRDPSLLQPYSFRIDVGDCVESRFTNQIPVVFGANDGIFHGQTNTPEISQHMHVLRYDLLGTDGTAVSWNYDISARSGETVNYRWFLDVNTRTNFNHDHQFPNSHQENGLHAAMIAEPPNSTFRDSTTGLPLGPTISQAIYNQTSKKYNITDVKGVGVAADILVNPTSPSATGGTAGGNVSVFREFVIQYGDFNPSFVADPAALKAAFDALKTDPNSTAPLDPALRTRPFNPPFDPDNFGKDRGISPLNYRDEPFQVRVNLSDPNATAIMNEPAYVFSSRVHGDPETAVFRAYPGDPVVIRLMDGAQEEHHGFEMHGHSWLIAPNDNASVLTDSQYQNIAEFMNYEIIGNLNRSFPGKGTLKFADPGKTTFITFAGLPGDYLFGSMATQELWDGDWGIFRVENGNQPDLQPLPNNPNGTKKIPGLGLLGKSINASEPVPKVNFGLTKNNNPCPAGAPVKHFDIVAMQKFTVYNRFNGTDTDPFALMYVLAADEQAVLSGAKQPEPLVIRANAGDCVEVNLTDHLPDLTALANNTPVTMPMVFPNGITLNTSLDPNTLQHYGDAAMEEIVPAAVPFINTTGRTVVLQNGQFVEVTAPVATNLIVEPAVPPLTGPGATPFPPGEEPFTTIPIGGTPIGMKKPNPIFIWAKWPMGQRVSLHPHLLKEVASVGDGATVGFMRDQTIGPGESITYRWFANKELGAAILDDFGDVRSHRHHGLFAALVVEPANSVYLDPTNLNNQIRSGTSAVIQNTTDGTQFREFVPLFMNGLNLRHNDALIPDEHLKPVRHPEEEHQPCSPDFTKCEDVEKQGESGINYRTERLDNRVPLALKPDGRANEEIFNPDAFKVFSSTVFGDPATPVFEAFLNDPVVFRVMFPEDLRNVHAPSIAGHVWPHEPNDPGTNIVYVEGSTAVGKAWNFFPIGGAGGEQHQPGDYLYNTGNHNPENSGVNGGLWGIFRVRPVPGAPAPTIVPLTKPANLSQARVP